MRINIIKLSKTIIILLFTILGIIFIPYIVGYLTQYFSGILPTNYIGVWNDYFNITGFFNIFRLYYIR